jgi:hypothetical protein
MFVSELQTGQPWDERIVLLSMITTMLAALLTAASMQHFIDDTRIRGFFTQTQLSGARWGDYGESAAFLVEDTAGEIQCLAWPPTNEFQRLKFNGDIPRRTVAIIHTHPDGSPHPSSGDFEEARRLNLPIFVLTRTKITVANPWDGKEVMITRQLWAGGNTSLRCELASQWLAR